MKIFKIIFPYIILISCIFIVSIAWEYIRLPFNIEKSLPGQDYLPNLHSPMNDSLRFIIFIFFSLLFYFITKMLISKKRYKFFFENLFLNSPNTNKYLPQYKNLNITFNIIVLIIITQFLCLNFKGYVYNIDFFHEGLWLTASSNAIYTNEFWQSSYIGRGLFGNFSNYFVWKITNINTIGISRFAALFFVMLNKVLLVLISKNLIDKTLLDPDRKFFLFVFLSFSLIGFSDYNLNGSFSQRSFGLLLFLYYLLIFFDNMQKSSLPLMVIGLFSSASFFWYIDAAFYINITIFFLLIYLVLKKEFIIIKYTFFYILLGWIAFYFIFPKDEFIAFYKNTINIFLTIEYIQGLIYPTPFFSGDARSTRALLLIIITGVLTINLLIKNNDEVNIESKLSLIFLFLLACVNFKTALSRSDTVHIKGGLSITYIPLFYCILYFIITKINIKKLFINTKSNKNIFKIIFLFIFIFTSFLSNPNVYIKNLPDSFNSIKYLVGQSDDEFVNKNYFEFINFYKKISVNDKCIHIFTNEVAIPYLLKKPSCTKYYSVYSASPKELQEDYVKSLILNEPTYILYKSEKDLYQSPIETLTIVNDYILNNYSFFQKFNEFTIFEKIRK